MYYFEYFMSRKDKRNTVYFEVPVYKNKLLLLLCKNGKPSVSFIEITLFPFVDFAVFIFLFF